jgi:hypothetical protein
MREMLSTLDWSVAGRSSCKMARRQSKDSAFVRFVDVVFLCSIVHHARFVVASSIVLGLFIVTVRQHSSGKEAFRLKEA